MRPSSGSFNRAYQKVATFCSVSISNRRSAQTKHLICFLGVTVVSFFLKELTKDKRSLWQQIEDKVDIKIGQKLSAYHVERLRNEVFRVLETRFQQPNGFSSADLKVVLDKRHMVFPHNWQVLGWSYELPLGIIYWMPFMIAGYQQMIKEKKQPT